MSLVACKTAGKGFAVAIVMKVKDRDDGDEQRGSLIFLSSPPLTMLCATEPMRLNPPTKRNKAS